MDNSFDLGPCDPQELSRKLAETHTLIERINDLENKNTIFQNDLLGLNASIKQINDLFLQESKTNFNLTEENTKLKERISELEKDNEILRHDKHSVELQNDQLSAAWDKLKSLEEENAYYKKICSKYTDKLKMCNGKSLRKNKSQIKKCIEDMHNGFVINNINILKNPCSNFKEVKKKQCMPESSTTKRVETQDFGCNFNSFEDIINVKKSFISRGTQHKYSTTTRSTCTSAFIKKHNIGTNFPEYVPISIEEILRETIMDLPEMIEPIADLPDSAIWKTVGTCTKLENINRTIGFIDCATKSLDDEKSMKSIKLEKESPMGSMTNLNLEDNQRIQSKLYENTLEPQLRSMWSLLGNIMFSLIGQRNNDTKQWNELVTNIFEEITQTIVKSNNSTKYDDLDGRSETISIGGPPSTHHNRIFLQISEKGLKTENDGNNAEPNVAHYSRKNGTLQKRNRRKSIKMQKRKYNRNEDNIKFKRVHAKIETDVRDESKLQLSDNISTSNYAENSNSDFNDTNITTGLPTVNSKHLEKNLKDIVLEPKKKPENTKSEKAANVDQYDKESASTLSCEDDKLEVKNELKLFESCTTACPTTTKDSDKSYENYRLDTYESLINSSPFDSKRKNSFVPPEVMDGEKMKKLRLSPEMSFETERNESKEFHDYKFEGELSNFIEETFCVPCVIEPIAELDLIEEDKIQVVNKFQKLNESSLSLSVCNQSTKDIFVTEACNNDNIFQSPMSPVSAEECTETDERNPIEIPSYWNNLESSTEHKEKGVADSLVIRLVKKYSQNKKRCLVKKITKDSKIESTIVERLKNIINDYMLIDFNFNVIKTVRHKLINVTKNPKLICLAIIENVKVINDISDKDFTCSRMLMSEQFKKLICLVENLKSWKRDISTDLLLHLEKRIFSLNHTNLSISSLINLTLLYLKSIQMKNQNNPLRLFLYKCLYYYSTEGFVMIYYTLMTYPEILPKASDDISSDALVNAIQCVLNSAVYKPTELKQKELSGMLKYKYRYQRASPSREYVITMLIAKIREGDLHNVSYALALICKRNGTDWSLENVINAKLVPMLEEFSKSISCTVENDHKVALVLESISLILKPFPVTYDVTRYQQIFFNLLNATERNSIQEAAVSALLRLSRFGLVDCFNRICKWKPSKKITRPLNYMLKTFIYRRPPPYWIKLQKQL